MTRLIAALLGASVSALFASPAAAQANAAHGFDYRLDDGAMFQRGCFAPCLCPAGLRLPIHGTFRLTPTDSSPLFDDYTVSNVDWTVTQPDGTTIPIVGSGTFRYGGEVAITEELSLDLVVGNEPVESFDSGLVVAQAPFPLLDLTISIHNAYCFDTVIRVVARPFPKIEIDRDAIRWDADPPATSYDVVRGDIGTLRATGGDYRAATEECVASDLATLTIPFALNPAEGGGYWFLLRTHGGSYDAWDAELAAPRDADIDIASASCP